MCNNCGVVMTWECMECEMGDGVDDGRAMDYRNEK